jgi:hypothetical protein
MSIPYFSDVVTLIDVATRVINFINDLRHAQDDFVGLRSEAECLRICINALSTEECQLTLYWVSKKQRQDLETIASTPYFVQARTPLT